MRIRRDKEIPMTGPHNAPLDLAVVPGTEVDATDYYGISLVVVVQNKEVRWQVWGGNEPDYSDATVLYAERTEKGHGSSYSAHPAFCRFYCIKAQSVDGQGAITVQGVLRA
jgi:hypothetical protein